MGVAKYGKPEEMLKKIDEYFEKYDNPEPLLDKKGQAIQDKDGNIIYKGGKPTSSGLALFLGFKSRCAFTDYLQRPTFTDVVKYAKLKLQSHWEGLLATKNYQGAKYMLSNMNDGWQEPEALAKQQLAQAPVVAQVIFIDSKKGSYANPSDIPTIDAEVIPRAEITQAKRTQKASQRIKKASTTKKKAKSKSRK